MSVWFWVLTFIGGAAVLSVLVVVIFLVAGRVQGPAPVSPLTAPELISTEPYILLLHGRGNRPSFDRMRNCWTQSLERGVHEVDSRIDVSNVAIGMVDYLDWLYPQGPIRKRFCESGDDIVREHDETEDGLPKDVVKYFELDYAHYMTQPLIAALDRLHLPPTSPGALRRPKRPILLIAHSFGAVAAYDVIRSYDFQVDTLVTIGSPLGWTRDVQDTTPDFLKKLISEGSRIPSAAAFREAYDLLGAIHPDELRPPVSLKMEPLAEYAFPENKIERWVNFYDIGDPVANVFIAPFVRGQGDVFHSDDFLDSGGQRRVLDFEISNSRDWKHSSFGYLENEKMGKVVACFLVPTHDLGCKELENYLEDSGRDQ